MLTTFKATAVKTAEGLQVNTDSRGFKLVLDEPTEMGGTNTGMNPVEATLCALGACQSIVAAAFAQAQGFAFEEMHIELEGDLDPDGFTGVPPFQIWNCISVRSSVISVATVPMLCRAVTSWPAATLAFFSLE